MARPLGPGFGSGALQGRTAALNVRPGTLADLDPICALGDEINELHHRHEPQAFAAAQAGRDQDFWRGCLQSAEGIVLVADVHGALAGFITARISASLSASFIMPRILCRIGSIGVAQVHRRTGIGTALIRGIESWARAQAASEVRLEVFDFNESAILFYERLGYLTKSRIMCRALP